MRKAYYFHGNPIKFYLCRNYCPICNIVLTKKFSHKIINSKTEEAYEYASIFSDIDGGRLIGNFDSDIIHKVFYCNNCNLEIEQKTLFSYRNMERQILKIKKRANLKKYKFTEMYLNNDIVIEKSNFIEMNKVMIKLLKNETEFIEICFISQNRKIFEQAKYFKPTSGFNKIKKLIKYTK